MLKELIFLAAAFGSTTVSAQRLRVSVLGGYASDKPSFFASSSTGFSYQSGRGFYVGADAAYALRAKDSLFGALSAVGEVLYVDFINQYRTGPKGSPITSTPAYRNLRLAGGLRILLFKQGFGQAFFQLTTDYNAPLSNSHVGSVSITPSIALGHKGVMLTSGFAVGLNDYEPGTNMRMFMLGVRLTPQIWFRHGKVR